MVDDKDFKFKKEQHPPLKVEDPVKAPLSLEDLQAAAKARKKEKTAQEILDQSERIAERLKTDVDSSLADAIKDICLKDKFSIDGYELEWNRMSRKLIDKLDRILLMKDLPERMKKAKPEEKQEWLMKEYYKLVYKGFTDDMYFDMSIPALKVLEQAPYSRMVGLFRQQ